MLAQRILDPPAGSGEVISLSQFGATYRETLLAQATDLPVDAVRDFDSIQILELCSWTNQNFNNLISCHRQDAGPCHLEARTLHLLRASHGFPYEWVQRHLGAALLTDLGAVYQVLLAIVSSAQAWRGDTVIFHVPDRMKFVQRVAAYPNASGKWRIESVLASQDSIHACDRLITV